MKNIHIRTQQNKRITLLKKIVPFYRTEELETQNTYLKNWSQNENHLGFIGKKFIIYLE